MNKAEQSESQSCRAGKVCACVATDGRSGIGRLPSSVAAIIVSSGRRTREPLVVDFKLVKILESSVRI